MRSFVVLISFGVFTWSSLVRAAELPFEPEAAEVEGATWDVVPAPDAPWGLKPAKSKGLPEQPTASAAMAKFKIHVVQSKETLSLIARKYGTSVKALQELNGLKSDVLKIGQKLKVSATEAASAPSEVAKPEPIQSPAGAPVMSPKVNRYTETVRLQVFLDRMQFCPGKIDGRSGQFMTAAIARFKATHPNLATDEAFIAEAAREVPRPWVTYKLREGDFSFIQNFGTGWPALAAQKFPGYRSGWELVAERFHVSEEFLKQINPHLEKRSLQAGDAFLVPNVDPFLIESAFPKRAGVFAKKGLPVNAVIRQKDLMLELVRGTEIVACYPITLGKPETRGKGDWKIVEKIARPSYHKRPRANDAAEARGKSFTINPGPNNPVGVLWMSLQKPGSKTTSSQGLHGTYTPDTIGRATSLGCIRLANWDILRAAQWLNPGATLSWR